MTTSTKYSIWLMPNGEIASELSKTISQLSQQYAAPLFPPHMTLFGGVVYSKRVGF